MIDENILEQFTDKELQTFIKLRNKKTKSINLGYGDTFRVILQLEDGSGISKQRKIEKTGLGLVCTSDVIQNINEFLSED
ncbi:MAG: hypothetical protein K8E24_003145 [Methanobacterium paludis]|nr:hypothetical protein [Methanobacterium paludis]